MLLYFLMTLLNLHESLRSDFSASVLTSYSNFELSLWSTEHVESENLESMKTFCKSFRSDDGSVGTELFRGCGTNIAFLLVF